MKKSSSSKAKKAPAKAKTKSKHAVEPGLVIIMVGDPPSKHRGLRRGRHR